MTGPDDGPFVAAYRRAAAVGRTLDLARRVELGEALAATCLAYADALDDATEASRPETERLVRRNALYRDELPLGWSHDALPRAAPEVPPC
jgi:hypothetical protein